MSATSQAILVAEREVVTQVRSKSFVISEVFLLVVVFLSIVIGNAIGSGDSTTRVAVAPDAAAAVAAHAGLEAVPVADRAAAEAAVRSGDVDAAVVADSDSPAHVLVIAEREAPASVVAALSIEPEVELLSPSATPTGLRMIVALIFGMVFMMGALSYGATIMQNVVTEKQTRIVEILLAAVPPRAMLSGKIAGNSLLAFLQIASIAAVAVIALVVTGQTDLLRSLGAPIVWFVIFFIVGFVLLAAMFAAAGATVSRIEDTGTVMMPLMVIVMAPYFLVLFLSDNTTAMAVMSYIPFTAPVAMPLRMFFGEAAGWEPIASLATMAICLVLIVAVASKVYANTLLRIGARVPLREALRRENAEAAA